MEPAHPMFRNAAKATPPCLAARAERNSEP